MFKCSCFFHTTLVHNDTQQLQTESAAASVTNSERVHPATDYQLPYYDTGEFVSELLEQVLPSLPISHSFPFFPFLSPVPFPAGWPGRALSVT